MVHLCKYVRKKKKVSSSTTLNKSSKVAHRLGTASLSNKRQKPSVELKTKPFLHLMVKGNWRRSISMITCSFSNLYASQNTLHERRRDPASLIVNSNLNLSLQPSSEISSNRNLILGTKGRPNNCRFDMRRLAK